MADMVPKFQAKLGVTPEHLAAAAPDVKAAFDKLTKLALASMIAAIVMLIVVIILAVEHHKLKKELKAKSSFEDGQKAQGVMVLPSQSLINRISGSTVSAHQGSVAAGGLFEHDLPTVQQNSPFAGTGGPKLHCAPDEIEGISMVTDAQTGEQVKVVNCYDSAGVLQPPRPRRPTMQHHMMPQPKLEPEFSQTPTMDCNGVWDYGAEGELGAQTLMGNTAPDPYAMMGARKFDSEVMSMA